MANINDFGVTAAMLNAVINPSKDAHSFWIGPARSGHSGTGNDSGSFIDDSLLAKPDQYNDFYLVTLSDNQQRLIVSSQGATVTCLDSPDLSEYSGEDYEIRARDYMATADATAVVSRTVGTVKGSIPERYRSMLYEISGEQIVQNAVHMQGTAHTSFHISDPNQVNIWRNLNGDYTQRFDNFSPLISPRDQSSGYTTYSDYTLGTATVSLVTFQIGGNATQGLARNDKIYADYPHDLQTVPKVLQQIVLWKTAYELLWQSGLGQENIPDYITAYKNEADALLEQLRNEEIGIDEFDAIKLYNETRTDARSRYATVRVDRG